MAEKYEIELEFNVETNIENVTNNTVNFIQVTEKAGEALEKAEKKGKDFGETLVGFGSAVLENGTAMEMLNQHTHGYFDKVNSVVEVTKLLLHNKRPLPPHRQYMPQLLVRQPGS
ncbi:hypothetical protein AAEO56_04610 [Flavobacterium sp. DGU11]|uniref:Uncharacterized protein n=1 Tax=Flavobacterium arundinis TaxID=3139143 RepID=A0ABU9HUM9_9FLAO